MAAATLEEPVELARPFLPEPMTPLFFTPGYATLSPSERVRYNQLQGLYFNEQIAFFEEVVGGHVLPALLGDYELAGMRDSLRQFAEEERRHTALFRELNRQVAPHLYARGDFFFIRVPRVWGLLLEWTARRPRQFPMFLWLMLLQEERSLYYSREILRSRRDLEAAFVQAHRTHLADEVDHVRWDEELLDRLWGGCSPAFRRANAALFRWMLAEFFYTPKRAQLRVLDQLVEERPELAARLPELRRQVRALERDPSYRATLYSRRVVPRIFARFDRWPEFGPVLRMVGEG